MTIGFSGRREAFCGLWAGKYMISFDHVLKKFDFLHPHGEKFFWVSGIYPYILLFVYILKNAASHWRSQMEEILAGIIVRGMVL